MCRLERFLSPKRDTLYYRKVVLIFKFLNLKKIRMSPNRDTQPEGFFGVEATGRLVETEGEGFQSTMALMESKAKSTWRHRGGTREEVTRGQHTS